MINKENSERQEQHKKRIENPSTFHKDMTSFRHRKMCFI